jgi:hypothetical protein
MKNTYKKLIKFPSIDQFATVATNINRHFNFVGLDENGDAIYDKTLQKPKLNFKGRVKLHGTNAGECYNEPGGIWSQSKENIITVEKDNAGFAFFAETKKAIFQNLMAEVMIKNNLDMNENTVSIYGEWCGSNIQSTVGLTNLEKSFFIFGVKISPFDENEVAYWVDHSYLRSPENKIYNIDDYETFEIEIDFNVPQLSQNKLNELALQVEAECPVAKAFGYPNTIGEGIVWSTELNGVVYRFKVKGDKHAGKSKVKTLKVVDDVKIMKCLELADKVTPIWRLSQMLEQTFDFMNGGLMTREKLGEYIKAVTTDIVKEEILLLTEYELELKDIGKYVSEISRKYFFEQETERM